MNPVVAKVLKKTLTTSATVVGALFVVYFWNLDQKLMGWLYKQVNTMFDRKPTDIKFCTARRVSVGFFLHRPRRADGRHHLVGAGRGYYAAPSFP